MDDIRNMIHDTRFRRFYLFSTRDEHSANGLGICKLMSDPVKIQYIPSVILNHQSSLPWPQFDGHK